MADFECNANLTISRTTPGAGHGQTRFQCEIKTPHEIGHLVKVEWAHEPGVTTQYRWDGSRPTPIYSQDDIVAIWDNPRGPIPKETMVRMSDGWVFFSTWPE